MRIGNKEIGPGNPSFIIAELSANHGRDLQVALDTVKAAAEAGADAIKLQTYTPDTLTMRSDLPHFMIGNDTIWDGKSLYELYEEAYMPWDWHGPLFEAAREAGILCFSSPFDPTAVDLLESFDVPAYKIASFEITDIPLIRYVASKGKPVILSTGVAAEADIELAVETIRKEGNNEIALLQCTSSYPAPVSAANLAMIPDLAKRFGVISGLSDHTIGHLVPVVATAMGSCIVEKHFILDKSIGGPDAAFSMTPEEFGEMVRAVRDAESAVGQVDYSLTEKKQNSRFFARSLFAVKDIAEGEVITNENVRSIRPAIGLHPRFLPQILGNKALVAIEAGTPLTLEMFGPA